VHRKNNINYITYNDIIQPGLRTATASLPCTATMPRSRSGSHALSKGRCFATLFFCERRSDRRRSVSISHTLHKIGKPSAESPQSQSERLTSAGKLNAPRVDLREITTCFATLSINGNSDKNTHRHWMHSDACRYRLRSFLSACGADGVFILPIATKMPSPAFPALSQTLTTFLSYRLAASRNYKHPWSPSHPMRHLAAACDASIVLGSFGCWCVFLCRVIWQSFQQATCQKFAWNTTNRHASNMQRIVAILLA